MALSVEEKKQILNNNIRRLEHEEYDLETRAGVLKKVGDNERYEELIGQIEKVVKMQDAYKEKIGELDE